MSKSGTSMIESAVFRQYDIRGIIGTELPLPAVSALADAIALFFASEKQKGPFVIGRDGRVHSDEIHRHTRG